MHQILLVVSFKIKIKIALHPYEIISATPYSKGTKLRATDVKAKSHSCFIWIRKPYAMKLMINFDNN